MAVNNDYLYKYFDIFHVFESVIYGQNKDTQGFLDEKKEFSQSAKELIKILS